MAGVTKYAAGPGNVELGERVRKPVGPSEVAHEVAGVGVCGTDLHIWLGEYPCVPPVTLGHEICGVVVEVGGEVDPGWLNKRVVVETYYSTCRSCPYCRTRG
jgi:L-iditol 2-dehydrogenase